jgi:hypothetical protein
MFKQIAFVGGKAGGSSQYAKSHAYRCAFQAQGQPGQCSRPWANVANQFPAIVFYQFQKHVRASRLSFSSRTDSHLHESPSNFDIIASNDVECTAASDWITIKKVRGISWQKLNLKKSWDLDQDDVGYRCWGIRCLTAPKFRYCSIQGLTIESGE